MSLAQLDLAPTTAVPPRPSTPSRGPGPAIRTPGTPLRPVPAAGAGPAPAPLSGLPRRDAQPVRRIPSTSEARGFVLYVGVNELTAAADGTSLGAIVEALKQRLAELTPHAESYAAVALAPAGVGGRDVDVVRLALQDPTALAEHRRKQAPEEAETLPGVIIDITRKRVSIDGENVGLTYKEFELLQFLVLREGRTIERNELIESLWHHDGEEEVPNERTIDVHVRRLRAKLGSYEDIVRTVRGAGYRFDRHADVSIRYASAPSPDVF